MNLICAATHRELQAAVEMVFPADIPWTAWQDLPWAWRMGVGKSQILLAATGVGIPMTCTRLMTVLRHVRPELIINVGIAGAYPGTGLRIGDIVIAESETFGDLGMESPEPDRFIPLAEQPFADAEGKGPWPMDASRFLNGTAQECVKIGKGATVNACTGTEVTGMLRRRITGADFETMEGAAVAMIAAIEGVPACEVRAISNFAARRDMRPENIQLALDRLRETFGAWLKESA